MSDDMAHLRDPENGQYVSLSTLFQRERIEHSKDHEQEREVARETAQRLEREVEQTALRLERVVEETAVRIEKAVSTALQAVAETARVHADAHAKEHIAHERIHTVEKSQVDKAEQSMNKRLEGMNEFRQALQDQAARSVPRELFDQRVENVNDRLVGLERVIVGRDAFTAALAARDQQIESLNNWRSRATGAGAVLALLAGAIGAAIMKLVAG